MSGRRRGLRPAGAMLGRAMRKVGGGPDPSVAAAREAWTATVGDAVSAAAQPVRRARSGVVTVACSDASWAAELRARSDELIDLVRGALPDDAEPLSGLRFIVADRPPGDEPPPAPRPIRPTEAERNRGEALVSGVDDDALRALLARAAATSVARERKTREMPANSDQ